MLEWRALFEMASLPYALPLLMQAPQRRRPPGAAAARLHGQRRLADRRWSCSCATAATRCRPGAWGATSAFAPGHASAIEQKIRYLHHESGRKVSLVGWSLGGVFALYGAHQASECVRNVITLGSPVSVDAAGQRRRRRC